MALFHLIALDKADSLDLRMANRPDHLAWGAKYGDKIKMAGPVLAEDGETSIGSAFVIEMESLADAHAWHAEDPYVKAGLFDRVEIRPFKWIIGSGPG